MEKIANALKESGFTDKESVVYTALLSCGTASAYTIAEKAGLKPPTAYLTLQNLIRKGLAYSIPRAKKKLFSARDPREVIVDLEKRTARAKQVLPDMIALIPAEVPRIKIHYYQGLNGIQESFDYGLKHGLLTKEVVGFYASGEKVPKQYIEMSEKYMRALKNRGVHVRGITPEHASIQEIKKIDDMLGHALRTIPYKDYSAKASIEAEDKIVRIILNQEQRAIVIDNPELAQMVKQIFEMVFARLEETNTQALKDLSEPRHTHD